MVVDVDGSQHMESEQAARDLQRDAFLASQGLRVLRFDDLQVLKEIEGVMEVILRAVSESLEGNPPNPLCEKGGGCGSFPRGAGRGSASHDDDQDIGVEPTTQE